jgi:hypothetical protein
MTDTHSWHKPHTAPKDRPFLAWCPDATIPFTVVKWSNEFKNFTRIDTRGLTADFEFWMELPKGPHGPEE